MILEIQKVFDKALKLYIKKISEKYNIPIKQQLTQLRKATNFSKKSNINGKSLEYVICKQINDKYNVTCVSTDYDEYSRKYMKLSDEEKKNFDVGARVVCDFFNKKFGNKIPVYTYLYSDSKGKDGLSADVVISYKKPFFIM